MGLMEVVLKKFVEFDFKETQESERKGRKEGEGAMWMWMTV